MEGQCERKGSNGFGGALGVVLGLAKQRFGLGERRRSFGKGKEASFEGSADTVWGRQRRGTRKEQPVGLAGVADSVRAKENPGPRQQHCGIVERPSVTLLSLLEDRPRQHEVAKAFEGTAPEDERRGASWQQPFGFIGEHDGVAHRWQSAT
jgi:hypothetical protein